MRAAKVKALVKQESDLKKEASPMELDDDDDEGGVSLLGHENLAAEEQNGADNGRVGWFSSLSLR